MTYITLCRTTGTSKFFEHYSIQKISINYLYHTVKPSSKLNIIEVFLFPQMFRPLFFVPLAIALVLLQQVPTSSGTVAFTLASGATTLVSLTAAQSTALAAVAILGIKAKLIGGYLLSRRRGKRSAQEGEVPTIETFANLEVEDCYKRVICAASTGEVENPQVENVLALFNPQQFMQAPLSHKAMKFVEAARYGGSRRSVAKCEHRYTCSFGMDVLQDLF